MFRHIKYKYNTNNTKTSWNFGGCVNNEAIHQDLDIQFRVYKTEATHIVLKLMREESRNEPMRGMKEK